MSIFYDANLFLNRLLCLHFLVCVLVFLKVKSLLFLKDCHFYFQVKRVSCLISLLLNSAELSRPCLTILCFFLPQTKSHFILKPCILLLHSINLIYLIKQFFPLEKLVLSISMIVTLRKVGDDDILTLFKDFLNILIALCKNFEQKMFGFMTKKYNRVLNLN